MAWLFLVPVGAPQAFRAAEVGKPAPSLSLLGPAGARVPFPPAGGRAAVLFWRPDQEFSRQALADFNALAAAFEKRGMSFWAVAVAGATRRDAEKAAQGLRLSLPVYLDEERRAEEAYGIVVLPSTGIIGADGTLQYYLPSRNSNYRAMVEGRIQLALGELDGAGYIARLRTLGESVEEVDRARQHVKAGIQSLRAGQGVEAVRELEAAVAIQPDLLDAHLELGFARLEAGDPVGARAAFEHALRANPHSPRGRVGLGIALVRTGKRDEGIAVLKEAVQLNPDPVLGHFVLGEAYEAAGDLRAALHHYRWAVQKLIQGRR
jgi:tetratricopeptide (TPR) repeat protein